MTVATESLLCPMCDYDLRGQTEPRCPECGYRFDWDEMHDPARRKHKYLFEHHPERNLWSFTRTLLGGLRPRKFWSGLLPVQPSNPRRVAIYALVLALAALLPLLAIFVTAARNTWVAMDSTRQTYSQMYSANPQLLRGFGGANSTTQQIIDKMAPAPTLRLVIRYTLHSYVYSRIFVTHATLLFWPCASLLALMVFVFSMRRANLRRVHLVRCIVYCGDVVLWANLIMVLLAIAYIGQALLQGPAPRGDPVHLYAVTLSLVTIAMLLAFIYRLIIAVRKYLRFDHPIATVLATQIIVLLLWGIILTKL